MLDTLLIVCNISIHLISELRKSRCTEIDSNCGCFNFHIERDVTPPNYNEEESSS
jgi:hypothetical protein